MTIQFCASDDDKELNPITISKALIEHPANFNISELRQIDEHLLVYCNANADNIGVS